MTQSQRGAFYVALGSSFAAGPGLGPRDPGSPLISLRSRNGYPQQLARLLNVPSFADRTSSGATMRQVLKGGQMYLGPQIDALGPDTALVTLTAGGNDVSYIGDLMALAYRNRKGVVGFVTRLLSKGPKGVGERGFPALADVFRATLSEIRRRSPAARIVVVTYPTLLPLTGTCSRLGLHAEQVALMRVVAERLAELTRSAAREAGAELVDMAALSLENDVCSAVPWVNGPFPEKGDGVAFHPTLAGAKASAEAIARHVNTSAHNAMNGS